MRPEPTFAPPSMAVFRSPSSRQLLQLTIDVVTPMFGGGANAGDIDKEFPVNGTGVRGQLRFWWRACKAAGFATTEQLFAEEARFWGQPAQVRDRDTEAKRQAAGDTDRSPLDVQVDVLNQGTDFSPNDGPSYVLFPFQQAQQDGRKGVSFRLTISVAPGIPEARYGELLREAEAAVWAWITFGGIGARTRRGCGTLRCISDDAYSCWTDPDRERDTARFMPQRSPADWLIRQSQQYVLRGFGPRKISILAGALVVIGNEYHTFTDSSIDAWKAGIGELKTFRTLLKDASRSRLLHADLGLPIMLGQGDNAPRVQGSKDKARRLASSVVIKALPLSSGSARSMATFLEAPSVWEANTPGVELTGRGGRQLVPSELRNTRELTTEAGEVIMRQDHSSSRDGLFDFLDSRWHSGEVAFLEGGDQR